MNYYTIPPSKKLEGLVRFFWVFECSRLQQSFVYRSMADSCTELIFHYKGTFDELLEGGSKNGSSPSGLHSQTLKYRRFITGESFGIFGAYLYPYAVQTFFNLSPAALTDQMPDLQSALGKTGRELEERMMLAADNKTRCRILTRFLECRLTASTADGHPVVKAIQHVIRSGRQYRVPELADHFNLSERQFERKFREYSGFTPKLLMRITRFESACKQFGSHSQKSLTDIALKCGYYDQSHFIRDFREFSGYEPGEFFSGGAEGTEWRSA